MRKPFREMRKASSFSIVNTIRFPVQQQKQHLRAGEALRPWITDHFRYDALINRRERVSTWKGRGFSKTQSWFRSNWLPEQRFPSWISLAYTQLRWQQREYNIVLTHTFGELHCCIFHLTSSHNRAQNSLLLMHFYGYQIFRYVAVPQLNHICILYFQYFSIINNMKMNIFVLI